MQSKAATVEQYLRELPEDRRVAIEAIRKVILKNLPKGIREGMGYGMIGYFVPHEMYPAGYHCDPRQPLPFASIASQKNYMAIYMMHMSMDPALVRRFSAGWTGAGKKLDMGKSCVRFKRLEDVPLDVVGDTIGAISAQEYIAMYEAQVGEMKSAKKKSSKKKTSKKGAGKKAAKKKAAKKSAAKKASKKKAAKKPVAKKAAKKKTAKKGGSKKASRKKAVASA